MMQRFEEKKLLFAHLQQTQKIALVAEGDVYALLVATYLQDKLPFRYRFDANDKIQGEKFVVGLFFSDANNTLQDANITLNHQPPLTITPLEHNNTQLAHIPLKNSWSQYYLIHFAHSPQKVVSLEFGVEGVETKSKKFYKVARYLLEPK